MEIPVVNAYSVYYAIAEKFEAIVSLGRYNSRYKDFYDIYAISQKYDIDGLSLSDYSHGQARGVLTVKFSL